MEKIKAFFKKVKEWLVVAKNWLGADGYMHLITCIAMVLFLVRFTPMLPWYWAGLITFGIGLIKEGIDYFVPSHTAEIKDLICDFFGTAIGVLLYLVTCLL